jgi:hypothetical protein
MKDDAMLASKFVGRASLCALAIAISACGDGGGTYVAAIPPSPVTPPPAQTSNAVAIFPSTVSQEFATVGLGSPIRIRYDQAANRYEVMPGAAGWSALVDDPSSKPLPGNPNVNFDIAGWPNSYFMIRAHYAYPAEYQYRYSNLAVWAAADAAGQGVGGITAFGMPTPVDGIPRSGSASYSGIIEGGSTVQCTCGWDPGQQAMASVQGTVALNFNFATGSLSGALHPYLYGETLRDLGALPFGNAVFGVGSQTFSGTFATNLSGPNAFSGQFTGPAAEELIGKWAFPLISPYDGSLQSASGAMIAKRP